MKTKTLIIILGPTGVGKTDLSIEIAQKFNTVIISADSRQIYKEMNIGTAVPSAEQLAAVKHYCIQHKSIHDYYNASMFEVEVLSMLDELFTMHDVVVMTGGSMMYIDVVCKGIDDLPTIDMKIRNKWLRIWKEKGLEFLQSKVKEIDPEFYAVTDVKNPKRMLKALEIYEMTGKPYSDLRTGRQKQRDFNIVKIGLNREREELYKRINQRVDEMMKNGLMDEARPLLPHQHINSLNTVGYKELFDYFEEKITLNKAVELIKRDSRRYAKRQLSWFKRDKEIEWFHPDETQKIINFLMPDGKYIGDNDIR